MCHSACILIGYARAKRNQGCLNQIKSVYSNRSNKLDVHIKYTKNIGEMLERRNIEVRILIMSCYSFVDSF